MDLIQFTPENTKVLLVEVDCTLEHGIHLITYVDSLVVWLDPVLYLHVQAMTLARVPTTSFS